MIDWKTHYENHDWNSIDQKPLTKKQRLIIERLAVEQLGVTKAHAAKTWGVAYPPGRHAATVIHIPRSVRSKFSPLRQALGFKIFNTSEDSKWLGAEMVRFHTTQRRFLPGLPAAHVQEVVAGGVAPASDGIERKFLIQEWIAGKSLESLVKSPLAPEQALQILDDLFLRIVIPLWAVGNSWWDVRQSNYVVTPDGKLFMIDSDVLQAYTEEKLTEPAIYTRRNSGRITALRRYATLVAAVATACPAAKVKGQMAKTKAAAKKLFVTVLRPALSERYPLKPHWRERAEKAYGQFRQEFNKLLTLERSAESSSPSLNLKTSAAGNAKKAQPRK